MVLPIVIPKRRREGAWANQVTLVTLQDTSDTDDPTMIDDSVLTGNESVRAPSKNVKTTGDKEVVAESGNRSSVVGTPSKKSRMKTKSPIHREWKSMRQRVLSLAQQVSCLGV